MKKRRIIKFTKIEKIEKKERNQPFNSVESVEKKQVIQLTLIVENIEKNEPSINIYLWFLNKNKEIKYYTK